jgi:hypothetical protein
MVKIAQLAELLDKWILDDNGTKKAFLELYNLLESKEGISLSFKTRPGVSYSLRAIIEEKGKDDRILTMVDIIDDDPENRWLSICFYADTITDPKEEGDVIPGGLLGEDGYCFDLFEEDDEVIAYLKDRINEACEFRVDA